MSYAIRDYEVVDYQCYELGQEKLEVRGPKPPLLPKGGYIACLGAAQTFGAFVQTPYPAILQDKLGMPTLNLGFGGAGPSHFLRRPELIDLANDAALVLVQVMSARSVSNSLYESDGTDFLINRNDGSRISGMDAFEQSIQQDMGWWKLRGRRHIAKVVGALGGLKTKQLVQENRENYLKEYESLLAQIKPPTVLFYWSERTPQYTAYYDRATALFGKYPQLVNQPMVEAMRPLADAYVQCVTDRGMPQRLISRFTGEPTTVKDSDARDDLDSEPMTHNHYYPSPEMHEDVAKALEPVCKQMLNKTSA